MHYKNHNILRTRHGVTLAITAFITIYCLKIIKEINMLIQLEYKTVRPLSEINNITRSPCKQKPKSGLLHGLEL